MGGIGFSLSLVTPVADREVRAKLHHELWNLASARMEAHLFTHEVVRQIVVFYARHIAYEGLNDAGWDCLKDELSFSFNDGGGNCYPEMYASYHWTVRAFETAFDDAQGVARKYGTVLKPLEYGAGEHAFFFIDGGLAAAATTRDPAPDHQIWLRGDGEGQRATTLAELPAVDRERARKVIVERACECAFCRL